MAQNPTRFEAARLALSVRVKSGPNVDKIVGSGDIPKRLAVTAVGAVSSTHELHKLISSQRRENEGKSKETIIISMRGGPPACVLQLGAKGQFVLCAILLLDSGDTHRPAPCIECIDDLITGSCE